MKVKVHVVWNVIQYFILLIMAKQVRDGEETPAHANILTL